LNPSRGTFFIWVDNPRTPERLEHWHQSSTVLSIKAIPDEEPRMRSAGG
jgi:hypothetical protein